MRIFLMLMIFATTTCFAKDSVERDVRCFVSNDSQKIRFELVRFSDNRSSWSGGYVKYGKNKPLISIVFVSSKPTNLDDAAERGRPAEFENKLLEIMGNEITGSYIFFSEGALINSMEYTNRKTGKKFSFTETLERADQDSCKW